MLNKKTEQKAAEAERKVANAHIVRHKLKLLTVVWEYPILCPKM